MEDVKVMGFYLVCVLELLLFLPFINSEALSITQQNYHDTLNKNKIVFLNFYADWCMFSQQLTPIFHKAADIIHEEYQNVKLGRVDADTEIQIAMENGISKYPTMKLYRDGKPLHREYRGSRSVDAFSAYIKQQLKPTVTDVFNPVDFKIDDEKNTFVGYFKDKNGEAYKVFERLADEVFETHDVIACMGEEAFSRELAEGDNVLYKPKTSSDEHEETYTGNLASLEDMRAWWNEKAHPLIREITFDNGEELTEEGLPFLILFYNTGDITSINRFKNGVTRELLGERGRVNFLKADGTTFSHPLHHLGKSVSDLPLICIDSFRHMYLFKKFDNVDVPGKLKQFIDDLHSGKLHQDFHNPEPDEEETVQEIPQVSDQPEIVVDKTPEVVADGVVREPVPDKSAEERKEESGTESPVNPPKSVFQKIAPSKNRYTLLNYERDEL